MAWEPPQAATLPDGRLHLHHGPIDLIVDAEGAGRDAGLAAAVERFQPVLTGLAAELPALRTDIAAGPVVVDPVGRAMAAAVRPFAPSFVTPMAAVAGAVADAVLAAMTAAGPLDKAYVNNGGDVAFWLSPGAVIDAAIAAETSGRIRIGHDDPVRGVATSGWRGRSHSLGVADAVTVLAATAARADAAATMLANAVDLPGHPAVARTPAADLAPDSDLGARPVTVGVGPLTRAERGCALDAGVRYGEALAARGLIQAAALMLGPDARFVGARRLLGG